MKKLISVFAALALVGSLAAQKGKKPAAKAPAAPAVAAPKAPAAPVVAAPSAASAIASGKAMGLSFGITAAYVTDMFKQGDKLKDSAGRAGGEGLKQTFENAAAANNCTGATGVAGSSACSASGTGSAVSLNGIDIGLKVQYDVTSWLFIRSGGNYVLGMKNTYEASRTYTAGGVTTTDKATLTANGSIIEIPALLGFNLVSTDKGTIYFAGGVAYNIGQYETVLSATQTLSAGTATTYNDVTNTTKFSGLGLMAIIGGKVKVTDGISLFGEMKLMSSAGVGAGKVTGTQQNAAATTTAATANPLTATNSFANSAGGGPTLMQGNTAAAGFTGTNNSGTGGLDFSYTRWQVGVQYEM